MQAEVLVATPMVNQFFSYQTDMPLKKGQVVLVPFRKKSLPGIVMNIHGVTQFKGTLRPIDMALPFHLSPSMLQFIEHMASYTLSPLGQVAKMVLPFAPDQFEKMLDQKSHKAFLLNSYNSLILTPEQQHACNRIFEKSNSFQVFLLDGVTGSGKTAVYMETIRQSLQQGQQALVLLPEIALTNQLTQRFEDFFQHTPDVWHSKVLTKAKRTTWNKAISAQPMVVVGARSALFLPFQNLGITIIDEEHDGSFKQEEQSIYHGRDMAILRAKFDEKPIILSSATPSVESMVNVRRGKYEHLILQDRFHGTERPHIGLIDMRHEKKGRWISNTLQDALEKAFSNNQQALLFLNRRGYAPISLCHHCGYRFTCLGCSACLVQHKNKKKLECHHCGYGQPFPPKCPHCQAKDDFLVPCGPGVERVAEEFSRLFPNARPLTLTSEDTTTEKNIQAFIDSIANHDVDCIIGTQILAKGHHFPKLNLVGVIDADMGLTGADVRASEKAFQLLEQVSGRAGREHGRGQVLLQTYNPTHKIIQAIEQQDRETFYELEIEERQQALMPPFGRLASIIISGLKEHQVEQQVRHMRQKAPPSHDILILGPIPAPLYKLRGRYRWRFLIKSPHMGKIQPYIRQWLQVATPPATYRLSVDIDPYTFS
jgi:primosomal protein N' (replication factor Y)